MACLYLTMLGPYSTKLDDLSLSGFEGDKVRALLAYLTIEAGHPHRRSALAGLLWPDYPESAARASLRNALSNLRLTIRDQEASPRYLICDQETIQFNLESNHWVDVRVFVEKIGVGNRNKPENDPECRVRIFKEAVELYQGSFLQGFSLRDSQGFEEWQLLKQEWLRRQALFVLAELTRYHEQRGEYSLACEYAQRQLGLEPWDEEAHRSLMQMFALNGQRNLALVQFETCQRSLKDELGVQPEPETALLYEQIRDGHLSRVEEAKTQHHNLPAALSAIIGRDKELVEIGRKLADRSCRLLTLIGPGGIGKTRLALEAAHQNVERFQHGVYFISLAPLNSVGSVIVAVAQALGSTFQPTSNPRSTLLEFLRQKELLLILDNFEHILEATELVIDILQTAAGVKILATSRARLNVHEEYLLQLEGLDFPAENVTDVNDALCYDAICLFLEGVERVKSDYHPTEQDLKAIVSICQQVQGMPLAILLASNWSTILPVVEISIQLSNRCLDFLKTEWRDLSERQRSMVAVFEHSYSLLTGDEQNIFEGLGVFQGSFSYQAACSVTQADLFLLRSLVDKTMLQRAETGRFELHPLLRQYALKRLAARPEIEQSLCEQHSRFFTAALSELSIELQGPYQAEAVRTHLLDFPNAKAAWIWAIEHRQLICLEQATDGLSGIYQWCCLYSEGEETNRLAAASLRAGQSGDSRESETCLLVRILAWQVYFANILGQVSAPKRILELASQLLERLKPVTDVILSTRAFLLLQSGLYYIEKDHSRAWEYWMESLTIYRKLGFRWREAQILEYLGWSAPHQDAFKTSRAWLEESLVIRRTLEDKLGVATTLQFLSLEAAQEGDFERMAELIQDSLESSRDLENQKELADAKYTLAVRLTYLGKYAEALIVIKETARQYTGLGMQEAFSLALINQCWIETNLGCYDQARANAKTAMGIALQTNTLAIRALGTFGLGEILAAEGFNDLALSTLQESISIYRQMPRRDEMGMALSALAAVEARLGRLKQAILDIREGIFITNQAGSWQAKVYFLANFARFKAEQGELEKAIELYALATRHPYLGNSRFWWDVAGKRLTELASSIPKAGANAAEKRGKSLDLEETLIQIDSELANMV